MWRLHLHPSLFLLNHAVLPVQSCMCSRLQASGCSRHRPSHRPAPACLNAINIKPSLCTHIHTAYISASSNMAMGAEHCKQLLLTCYISCASYIDRSYPTSPLSSHYTLPPSFQAVNILGPFVVSAIQYQHLYSVKTRLYPLANGRMVIAIAIVTADSVTTGTVAAIIITAVTAVDTIVDLVSAVGEVSAAQQAAAEL